MTHGHPTQSPHQHGPHSGADPHADCGHDHRGGVHVHNHAPKDFGFAFALGTALNVGFVVLEAAAGVFANSMALLADAGHNLSDVLCLLMAWGASVLVKRRPTLQYTYGFGSSTILAALANAVLLLVAVGAIAWEAVQRLSCAAARCGHDHDRRRRARHSDQRLHRLAVCIGRRARRQYPRRLPSHGGRCRNFVRCRPCRHCDADDRLELARSGRQPHHCRG